MVKAVKGTRDIYFPEVAAWQRLERTARETFGRYGFTEIRTPILEHTQLFTRGIGGDTDIVTKEMYTFDDRKGRSLTLRPENTAGVARAVVEHGLHRSPAHGRLYYIGPQFRYERPQKGRYRQFYQIGAEVLGDPSPGSDAETIAMVVDFLEKAGILGLTVQLNSVGCPLCRPVYVSALTEALGDRAATLCGDCRRRLSTNPLRVLDCKVPGCQPVLDGAPEFSAYLCEACAAHYAEVKRILALLGVSFSERARLVRGLDYYTRTVFEVTSSALGAQDAIVGGGRYDGLLQEIGGPDTPAFGWALGIDRLLMAMPSKEGVRLPWLYLAWHGEGAYDEAVALARRLRGSGRVVVMDHAPRSFKSALKRADRLAVRWTVIIGPDEVAEGRVTLKDMVSSGQVSLLPAELDDRLESGSDQ